MWKFEMKYNQSKKAAIELSKKTKEVFGIKNVGVRCSLESADVYRRKMHKLIDELLFKETESVEKRLLKVEALMVTELAKQEGLVNRECKTDFEYRVNDERIELITHIIPNLIGALDVLDKKYNHLI